MKKLQILEWTQVLIMSSADSKSWKHLEDHHILYLLKSQKKSPGHSKKLFKKEKVFKYLTSIYLNMAIYDTEKSFSASSTSIEQSKDMSWRHFHFLCYSIYDLFRIEVLSHFQTTNRKLYELSKILELGCTTVME